MPPANPSTLSPWILGSYGSAVEVVLTDEGRVVSSVPGLGVGEGREGERPVAADAKPLLVPLPAPAAPPPFPLPLPEPAAASSLSGPRAVAAARRPLHLLATQGSVETLGGGATEERQSSSCLLRPASSSFFPHWVGFLPDIGPFGPENGLLGSLFGRYILGH